MYETNAPTIEAQVMCVTRVYYFFNIEVPANYQGTYREYINQNMVLYNESEATIIEVEEPTIESFKTI
jgi:hypothetical protein